MSVFYSPILTRSPVFFKPFLGVKMTPKFCDGTLNSESRDVILPCIEVKRFEENMLFCTQLLQQTAAML